MRIAVIGAGSVGRGLAAATAALGHDVAVGVRDPDDPRHADLSNRAVPSAAAGSAPAASSTLTISACPLLAA